MRKFNYILNDLAFETLVIKCLYGEPTDEDVKECENQIKLLQQENNQLKEENERYRKLGFKHLNEQNNQLKEVIEEVREYANDKLFDDYTYCSYEDIKQNINEILDKAKENK